MANTPLAQNMNALEEGGIGTDPDDPQFNAVKGSEPATEEEDRAMSGYLADAMEFIYSEKGMPVVMRALKQDVPLFETIPQLTKLILEKTLGDMKKAKAVDSSMFFGEGGLLQQIPLELIQVAQSIGIPEAQDQDTISASVIGAYKAAGEHVLASQDEDSIIEAQGVGAEMLLTQPDGSVAAPHQMQRNESEETAPVNLLGVQ